MPTKDKQEFRATPRAPVKGAIADAFKDLHTNYLRKQFGFDNPVTEAISEFLGIPAFADMMNRLSYGESPFKGKGETLQLKPWAVEGLVSLPAGAAAETGLRLVRNLPAAIKHGATEFAKASAGTASHVVKPKGNLNFTPSVLAEHLKGPERQKLGDFIKQIKGMKGLTAEGKKSTMAALERMDPNTVVTKQFVEDSFEPSRFGKIDLKNAAENADEHLERTAAVNLEGYDRDNRKLAEYIGMGDDPKYGDALTKYFETFHDTGIMWPDEFAEVMRGVFKTYDPDTQQKFIAAGIFDQNGNHIPQVAHNYASEFSHGLFDEEVNRLRKDGFGTYVYQDYQRLTDPHAEGYVEKGVTHPDAPSSYDHYELAEEPMVAHFRGTSSAEKAQLPGHDWGSDPSGMVGKVRHHDLDPNSFLIEELQSDVQKRGRKKEGPLHQAHATAFKAAVQHALEQGHDTVYLPTAKTIAHVRGAEAESFAPIYDQEVINYGLAPLSRMKGVSVEPVTVDDITAYHKIKFDPEAAKEILEGMGQSVPGFADGGSVSPFEGLEPTFGQKAGAYLSDKLTEGLISAYDKLADRDKLSAAHKIYLDTFSRGERGPITQADFKPEEMAELQNLIRQKEAMTGSKGTGYIQYEDYKTLPGGDQRRGHIASAVSGVMPPRPSLANALGQFNYKRDPKTGQYKIIDEYDFNPQKVTYQGQKVDVPADFYGDYAADAGFSPWKLARLYGGRKMPPGTGRKVDLSVDLRTKYFGK